MMNRIRRWFYTTLACAVVWWHEVCTDTGDDPNTLPPDSVPSYVPLECPDTEPTTPGALDSDLGRLR